MNTNIETVIGIPGRWTSRSELVTSIVSKSNGYMFAGQLLLNTQTKESYTIEIYDHDENLPNAFRHAGHFSDAELEEIRDHTMTLYLIGRTGDPESAKGMAHAVCGLLNAGGIAVKVETTGVAHTAQGWFDLVNTDTPVSLFRSFVTIVSEGDTVYSCGMHNLGHPDAIITTDLPPAEAWNLLATFLVYLLAESPSLHPGETFSIDPEAPTYRLEREECGMYPPDHLFYNPYGYWRLR